MSEIENIKAKFNNRGYARPENVTVIPYEVSAAIAKQNPGSGISLSFFSNTAQYKLLQGKPISDTDLQEALDAQAAQVAYLRATPSLGQA